MSVFMASREKVEQFQARKKDHLRQALDPAHQAQGLSGLGQVELLHDALPEIDFEEIVLESESLGGACRTPFLITGMTAGHEQAVELNRTFARVCHRRGWAMGVGSQRRQLREFDRSVVDQWSQLREEFPDLQLFGNIGVSQLIQCTLSEIESLVESIQGNGLAIHANALQEVIQPEGTPQFKGAIAAIHEVCLSLKTPVILKETGCGFSKKTFQKLKGLPLAAIDVSGLGGTHWGRIEGARCDGKGTEASRTFATWGVSTVDSILNGVEVLPEMEIWASGGLRTGLDAAKCIAMGASRVGYAQPALQVALQGEKDLEEWMVQKEFELKVALFCTGCRRVEDWKKEKLWVIN